MPWVLWDIVVPLILTFAIGLLTGWLLWRWRRQKASDHNAAFASVDVPGNLSATSATALIEERDQALARAEEAEQKVLQLSELPADSGASDSVVSDHTDRSPAANESSGAHPTIADDDQDEQLEALEHALHRERASKAELEQAFMDLNNRCASLSRKLDEATDHKNTAVAKDKEELQRKYDRCLQQIEESNEKLQISQKQIKDCDEKLKAAVNQHKTDIDKIEQVLADKESQLEALAAERRDALKKLELMEAAPAAVEGRGDVDGELGEKDETMEGNVEDEVDDDAVASAGIGVNLSTDEADEADEADEVDEVDEAAGRASEPEIERGKKSIGVSDNFESSLEVEDSNDKNHTDQAASEPLGSDSTDNAKITATDGSDFMEESANDGASADLSVAPDEQLKSTASGYLPIAWVVPERTPGKSERDNLQQIKGVGPVLEKTLHKTGIYYFEQLAQLDNDGVAELDSQLPQFSGRIKRDKWVAQAKTLHQKKYGTTHSE